ncbi:MAG TPA: type II secretion system F family protein [Candidatus Binatia bacterium]|jgi:tight adherence protein B
MNLLVIVLFSFLAAMSLIIVMFFVPMAVQNSPQARIKRRLTTVGRAGYTSRADVQNLLKSTLYSEVPWVNALLSKVKFAKHLDLLLERANVDMTLGLFILCSGVASGVAIFLILIVGKPFSLALVMGLIALVCPYFYLKCITWKRRRRFLEQLPDALDMMSQSLQAGLGLTQAMVFVAKEMPDPLGTEFSVFIEEVNLGLPLADALKKLEERMVLPEVRLFSTALLVQRDVGGSLAELLNKLADIIRDRFRIERLIKSLTGQNRMSAWTVCSVPPFLGVFMFIREPEMMNDMLSDPMGRAMLAVALVLEIIGIFVFRKLIKVHI